MMGRPKVYRERLTLLLSSELVERMERVRALRGERLGSDPAASDIYREAVAVGLATLEAEERSKRG